MCALLGLAFTKPILAGFSFQEFSRRGEDNADGWGLAWYPDQSAALVKEPVRWGSSPFAEFLGNYRQIQARIYIAHVRHRTTGGPPTHADTHPFLRELGGRHYCFAHNGTIPEAHERLPVDHYQPLGGTDSERFFCHLLDEMSKSGNQSLER